MKRRKPPQKSASKHEDCSPSLTAEHSARSAVEHEKKRSRIWATVCLGSLGVVFGDIGTSPLYAFRECFKRGNTQGPPNLSDVLGILSLITWSLIIVISIKYLLYVMAADNKGEGGILALLALRNRSAGQRFWFSTLCVFGAALLYGDGIITPAISVVSAVEGLKNASPAFERFIVPISIVILLALFAFQKKGSGKVGLVFGPVMLLWFAVLGVLGLIPIVKHPEIFSALNPLHALTYFHQRQWAAFVTLGAVFLVVTGGEALYADLGHFGRRAIRTTWFAIVLPALLLNYYGQGALLLSGGGVSHPFFGLAPKWALYPLVLLSAVAAVIASQAVISGVFSLTRQAVLMDQFPRVRIEQTSETEVGQVYVPALNFFLMFACIALVVAFPSSDRLAGAYGVAVSTTMVITTILVASIARDIWKWNIILVSLVTGLLLIMDLAFFGANILKFAEGGWFALLVGAIFFIIMTTWRRGRVLLHRRLTAGTESLEKVLDSISNGSVIRVPGTSVFLTKRVRGAPPVLVQHVQHSHALSENALIVHIVTLEVPRVAMEERIESEKLRAGIFRVRLKFGYLDLPDIPEALSGLALCDTEMKRDEITYYVARGIILPRERNPGMTRWREALFAFLLRNSSHAIDFLKVPPRQVVELGLEIDL